MRMAKYFFRCALLDDTASLHYRHALRESPYQRQIVRDQ